MSRSVIHRDGVPSGRRLPCSDKRTGLRVMLYSHDTYGLGHLRRSQLIADRIADEFPGASVLILTGSPRAYSFAFAPGVDTVKLPSIIKRGAGRYQSRSLSTSLEETLALRTNIIRAAIAHFRPDVFLVDHVPVGLQGELIPVFKDLQGAPDKPHLVLGMRDIVDAVDAVREEWTRLDAWRHIEETYDEILVYGDERVPNTAAELGLPRSMPGKVIYTGLVAREIPPGEPVESRPSGRVLVTAGGGGDAGALFHAYADYLESEVSEGVESRIVTGPFLSPRRVARLRERFEAVDREVSFETFSSTMTHHLRWASAVVSMGGYNSVTEILAAGVPALIVPRETPRCEQLLRAVRLSEVSDITVARHGDGLGRRIAEFVDDVGRRSTRPRADVSLEGLHNIVARLWKLVALGGRRRRGREA